VAKRSANSHHDSHINHPKPLISFHSSFLSDQRRRGENAFLDFLEKEFAVENLFFIEECEAFRSKAQRFNREAYSEDNGSAGDGSTAYQRCIFD
jgi:hypothetical protein